MAKQAASSRKTTKKPAARTTKPAAAKTAAAKTKPTEEVVAESVRPVNTKPVSFADRFNRHLSPEALVAEVIGTFILAAVALTATSVLAPLYVGLTLVVLAIVIGGLSGAHVNPAVTFGLWTARKFPGFALPFYWLAQFLGGFAAIVVMAALTGKGLGLNFNSFLSFDWGVFAIEVIGAAIFLFGIMAANTRAGVTFLGRAMGVGLSLFVALTVAAGLYTSLGNSVDKTKIASINDVPRLLRLDGPTLNPAIALGAREKTDAQLQGTTDDGSASAASRLTLGETLVGTLLGAALGANLYRVLGRRDSRQ